MPVVETVIELSRTWGPWLPFAGLAAETAGFPLPLPGEVWLLLAGSLVAAAVLPLPVALAAGALAALAGDQVGFLAGRLAGRRLVRATGGISRRILSVVRVAVRRFGPATVTVARFVPGVRTVAMPLAGAPGMPYRQFLAFDLIGAASWATAFILLGARFEVSRLPAMSPQGPGGVLLLVAALTGLSALALFRHRGWPVGLSSPLDRQAASKDGQ